jgi:hypothetical protein
LPLVVSALAARPAGATDRPLAAIGDIAVACDPSQWAFSGADPEFVCARHAGRVYRFIAHAPQCRVSQRTTMEEVIRLLDGVAAAALNAEPAP